jgi:hypothetical protein
MNDVIKMPKEVVECFTAKVKFGNGFVDVLFVPRYGKKPGWVGPGFWERLYPKGTPPEKYNERIYSREELIKAGAKSKIEFLWGR